ncbi:MAG: protein kinase [Kofleriaceae bacterium]|nr:protein kinase [Kofleriaceae bacterium]MBP6836832.1 protein kinase [Kofleriaceae bacterium]
MPAVVFLLDPSQRLRTSVVGAAPPGLTLVIGTRADECPADAAVVLLAPASAGHVELPTGPARWIVGSSEAAAKLAGAAATAGAAGVLLSPIAAATLPALCASSASSATADVARARGLVALSLLEHEARAATLRRLADAFAADDCVMWWRGPDGVTSTTSSAAEADPAATSELALAARVAAAAAGTVWTSGERPRACIAEPLRTDGTDVAGLLAVVATSARVFAPGERADLKAIASRMSRELSWQASQARLVSDAEQAGAGLHDPLTACLTRSAFEQAVAAEVAAARRRGESLTIAFLDVVDLRNINSAHGHAVGDQVLAALAGRLRATLRAYDRISRFGGDEFAVLLTSTGAEQARAVILKVIAALTAPPLLPGLPELQVHIRGTVSELGPDDASGEPVFARTLAALRNTVAGAVQIVSSSGSAEGMVERPPLAPGTLIGGTYRVIHELSAGAMGVVYRAEDLGLGRPVAVKVLRSDLASDSALVTKFRAEAALLASLRHDNLVQIYALGDHHGDTFFAMELVEGQALSEVLRRHGADGKPFPTGAVMQIAMEIAEALDTMHQVGVIHRDVKPANVLLDRNRDRAVLVDVGVATRAGDHHDAAGTPGYAAPESFLGQSDAPEVDVYGLGATVYAMLTGAPPFGAGNLKQVIHRQLHEPLLPASSRRHDLAGAVDTVLAKALDPAPKKRWSSAVAFAVALSRALERTPTASRPPGVRTTTPITGPGSTSTAIAIDERAALDAAVDGQEALDAALAGRPGRGHPTSAPPSPGLSAEQLLDSTASLTRGAPRSTPSAAAGRVRAAHLRVAAKVIAHAHGEHALRALCTSNPRLGSALAPTVSPLAWLPLEVLCELLTWAEQRTPERGLPRSIGRSTIAATFARMFGANPSALPIATVLRAAPTFWRRYHDWSEMAIAVHDDGAEFDLSTVPPTPLLCELISGELERVCELAGAKHLRLDHAHCAAAGAAPHCQFVVRWG